MTIDAEKRQHRLQRVRLSIRQRLINNGGEVYLRQAQRADPWMTEEEFSLIVREIVDSGFACLIKGTLGGEKLMLPGDEAMRHAAEVSQ
jgi:hypothetical protein